MTAAPTLFRPAYRYLSRDELERRVQRALASLSDCRVCPRDCRVNRLEDKWAACKTGRYAAVSTYFPHFGEEDCLRGWNGSGTIFFSHCNLRCVFCQNYDISQAIKPQAAPGATPQEIAAMMLELQAQGCHNINFVTPEHVVPQLVEALAVAVDQGLSLPIVYNTSAYDSLESLGLMDGIVDIYMPDFKYWNPERSRTYLKAEDYPDAARAAIKEMHRQVGPLQMDAEGLARRGLLIRHLVMPGCLDETRSILHWIATELGPDTYVNLMDQYYPAGKVSGETYAEINRRLTTHEFRAAQEAARGLGLTRLDQRRPRLAPYAALLSAALALNGCRLGDLVSTPASNPAEPDDLVQAKSDGTTGLALGSATDESVVTLAALVSDPDAQDTLRLELEVRPLGVAFTDSATATGTATANGAVVSVSVSGLVENAAYHWQARALDQTSRASAWVPFEGNAEDQADFWVDAVAEPPGPPASLAQLKSNGTTAIAVGAATDETTVVFQAALSDPDTGDSLRLEVERQPLGTQFTDQPTATSPPVTTGGTARVTLSGHLDNLSYHWQTRAIDLTGLVSAWVAFGGNPEVQADYQINIPEPPNAPTGLGQFRQNGQTAIAVGDTTTQTTVVLKATLTDPDPGDQVRLEVEVRPLGVTFSGTATSASSLVASGATASVSVPGLVKSADYHWQGRTVDQTGRVSSWVPFGGNVEEEADFRVR